MKKRNYDIENLGLGTKFKLNGQICKSNYQELTQSSNHQITISPNH